MRALPNLIAYLDPVAERYLTLLRVNPIKRYSYAKKGYFDLPVIEIDQHGPKCKHGESWLYFAVPTTASLPSLTTHDRLYVGAQTQDRMFRGDGLGGNNYHHGQMRAGNGRDTPTAFLADGQQIAIYRVRAQRIAALVSETRALEALCVLAEQPRTPKKHLGWWFEQYVLYSEPKQWRWNTASADKSLAKVFAS
jgi:hypothetical protein